MVAINQQANKIICKKLDYQKVSSHYVSKQFIEESTQRMCLVIQLRGLHKLRVKILTDYLTNLPVKVDYSAFLYFVN